MSDESKIDKVVVNLPSDYEERQAVKETGDPQEYVKRRSGRVRFIDVEEFSRLHPEMHIPYSEWKVERDFRNLTNSESCRLKWS